MSMSFLDVTFSQVLERIGAYVLVVAWYGWVSTVFVRIVGDEGPRHDGRQTPNPAAHLDLLGLVAAILFRVTWIKPLDSDVTVFRRPRLNALLIVVGATVALVLFGVLGLALRPVVIAHVEGTAAIALAGLFATMFEVSVATALLNLFPLPPLLGTHLLAVVRPAWHRGLQGGRIRMVGTIILAVVLMSGVLDPLLRQATRATRAWFGF